MWSDFLRAFFFSVETFGTIGYGHVAPSGIAVNTLITCESLVGLLSLALATGLVFARFSRPTAEILYSKHAVIAPLTVENGLLTPTQKIRRMLVIRANADLLAKLHG